MKLNEIEHSKTIEKPSDYKGKYLYHDTDSDACENILKHNYFRTQYGFSSIKGLSTHTNPNNYHKRDKRFVLDREKLEQDFELWCIDEQLGIDEFEVKVKSDGPIMNADKYIVRVEDLKKAP